VQTFPWGIVKGGDHLRGLVINGRVTLKWMLEKEYLDSGLSILFHKRQGMS
jgi:hypothetical protein